MVLEMQPRSETANPSHVVNDFTLMVATKNGSGSQTSNEVLIRSLFRMGIPVSGKNLFPSNIKGLPTWYSIRASKDGYIGRKEYNEIAVTFNELTAAEDISKIPAGGVCIIPADWKWGQSRHDITYYELPVKETVTAAAVPQEFRDRIANMVYVGACAYLFGISMDVVRQALLDTFNQKEKPAMMNFGVVERAFNWAQANLPKRDPYVFEPMNETAGKILITGNEAAALGSLFGGVSVVAWYPITPSTSLVDGVLDYRHIRRDPDTGKETVAVVQAEDELAAIGMLIGAGWAGARAMTSTSGPGISLMAEFTGLAYFAEIPCVVWDVTRVGPSTGLPTRTGQGDLLFLYVLSHGDTRHVVLLPGSVGECFDMGWQSLDLAEQLQTPVFVMSDLDLGMNIWMSDPFAYPDKPIQRGKTLSKETLEGFIEQYGEWYRYKDYDQDGVGYRTIPGIDHPKAAYFTRGTGHNEKAIYSERSEDWVANLKRIHHKFETARAIVPQPVISNAGDQPARIGIISYGSNDPAIVEARELLAARGIQTDYLRVRALPLAASVYEFIRTHEQVLVIENNFDGQMAQIIRMESSENLSHLKSLSLGDSLPMTAQWIIDRIVQTEG
ncbi:MAG: 2-oxoacid:acceptor oxidoreductase subunit alpha [Pleurocapsa minor GSE-CHR-MK-17-07R]|jgi:2-oxoglutarate ferredoxin oxidoreductase subunit alpha|nr:2-oxoacid:acceptor oxidoreductase subunit alpha [Pleurocapsa minor GSE-CHR-MK 17-07R]